MKKRSLFFSILIIGTILFNLSIATVIASDDDFDGIDDEFETVNNRNIAISFSSDEFEVNSILRTGIHRDIIKFDIRYNSDGIEINLRYNSEFEGENQSNFKLEFSVSFRRLIEFVDMDSNGIYDDSIDQTIQEVEIKDFNPINYSQIELSSNTTLHYIKLSTEDGIFTTHFYFSEEFTSINNSLISPSESKIDIEINNFNYTHGSSQLALYVKLESESDYEENEETEDEDLGFAHNETSVITANQSRIGFLSWKKSAIIDGSEHQIKISPIEVDDDDAMEQKVYINYPRGQKIYHDPKLGVEGILRSILQPPFPFGLTTIIIIVFVFSISIAYAAYHYRENLLPSIFLANGKKKETEQIPKKKFLTTSHKIEEILSNTKLTAISPDFFKLVEQFEFDGDEKDEFIKEMLALNPFERNLIIKEMIKKHKL
ncbi:MAG: hypothetical protein ACFFA4_06035 [Promethearchaeota archaeon]